MFSVFAVGGKQETRLGGNIGGQKPDQCIQIKWVILMTMRGTIIIHSLSLLMHCSVVVSCTHLPIREAEREECNPWTDRQLVWVAFGIVQSSQRRVRVRKEGIAAADGFFQFLAVGNSIH